jgi:hypothetical protein
VLVVDADTAVDTKAVPVVAGIVTVLVPDTSGADIVNVPLVSPLKIIPAIIFP